MTTRVVVVPPRVCALVAVAAPDTVRDALIARVRPWVVHVHVVLPPDEGGDLRSGLGSAIFGAAAYWCRYDAVLVLDGDQTHLSTETARRVVAAHGRATSPRRPGLTVPVAALPRPRVEYEFAAGKLARIRQAGAGDACRPGGLSDVGMFCLSTAGLSTAWLAYVSGAGTRAAHFLPFLPYLSQEHGWPVTVVPVGSPAGPLAAAGRR